MLKRKIILTKRQVNARLRPHRVNGKWFYLGGVSGAYRCSFHDGLENSHVHAIPISVLLRALDKCGYLDQWDRNQQVLRKRKP